MKRKIFISILLVITAMLTLASCLDGIANKKVTSIQILSGAPSEVTVGETPDFSELKAKVTYNDGETKEVGYADVTISAIDTSKAGKVEYSITYDGYSAKSTINVKAKDAQGPSISEATLESISLVPGTIQTEFVVGADFRTQGLQVIAHYSDGTTPTVSADKLNITQNVDPDTVGVQTLIVEYKGKTCEIKITVKALSATKITLDLDGFDNEILVGCELDTSAITGTVHYNNATTLPLANADITFSAVDTLSVGAKTLVATYNGLQAECNVTVLGVKSIYFSGFDDAIKYNEELDLTDLTATVIATNNKSFTIDADNITVNKDNFDTTLVGTNEKSTRISFSYFGASKEYYITVTADAEDATPTGLSYTSGVDTSIYVGETFNDNAIKATATLTFGYPSLQLVKSDLAVSGTVDNTEPGTYPITYSYTKGGVTKSFTLNVVVIGPNELNLNVNDLGWILKGDVLDTSSITATLYYDENRTDNIANEDLTITGADTSTAGNKTLTVSYEDVSATVTFTVVEIKSVNFIGVNSRYRLGSQIDADAVSVEIIGTDDKTYALDFNGTLPTLSLDNTKTSETKDYTIVFRGVEYTKSIEVYAEFEDATLLSIEYTGATEVFVGGNLSGKLSVKAYYTYGFTKDYTEGVTASALDTATKGERNITVSYLDKTANATITVRYPYVTNIVVNSAPLAIKGEAYGFNAINVTVTLENNQIITESLANLADYEIEAALDVTTAGEKMLTLTSNGKSCTHAVTVYEIEKIVLNTRGFNNIVQLGSEFSIDGLSEIYVYLVGIAEPVIRQADSIDHNVNTQVMSNDYTLTAKYLGIDSVPVKITVADQNFVITGAEDPASIVAWKNGTYQAQFLDQGYGYVVGDDNPFRYEIRFQMLDIINNIPKTQGLTYKGISSVKLNGVVVGDEYVTIDEINHTFDFTEAAIGKTFVITTAHKDYAKFAKEFTVTVVDGYNVHEAIELNLLTNRNEDISGAEGIYQLKVLHEFLSNNKVAGIDQMDYDAYKAFVDGINGIILHDNFTLKTSDFPDKYFFETSDGTKYLWDHESLYYREFTDTSIYNVEGATPEVFNLYGNYFTVLTYEIPIVAKDGTVNKNGTATNEDDNISSSQLFRFNVSSTIWDNAIKNSAFYHENYVANIYALGTRDDNPTLAVQPESAQLRSRLGIYAFKLASGTYNLYAVNAQAFFNTMTAEYDDLTVNIDYCSFYNAWNNHISTWTSNRIDNNETYDPKGSVSVHAGYDPTRINISNSFVGKSGGPAILAMVEDPDKEYNIKAGSKPIINIDDKTNIFSYVKGDESWFVSYSATPIAGLLASYNNYFPEGSTFLTKIGGGENNFMNMICLFMDAHFNPATFAGVTTDLNGSLTIGGKAIQDMDTTESGQYGHGGLVDLYRANAKGNDPMTGTVQSAPVFVSSEGGISFTDQNTGIYELTQTGPAPITSADHAAVQGDHLAMFLYNLGLTLGFNEPALNAEPTPADCTVERVTASHGYGN